MIVQPHAHRDPGGVGRLSTTPVQACLDPTPSRFPARPNYPACPGMLEPTIIIVQRPFRRVGTCPDSGCAAYQQRLSTHAWTLQLRDSQTSESSRLSSRTHGDHSPRMMPYSKKNPHECGLIAGLETFGTPDESCGACQASWSKGAAQFTGSNCESHSTSIGW